MFSNWHKSNTNILLQSFILRNKRFPLCCMKHLQQHCQRIISPYFSAFTPDSILLFWGDGHSPYCLFEMLAASACDPKLLAPWTPNVPETELKQSTSPLDKCQAERIKLSGSPTCEIYINITIMSISKMVNGFDFILQFLFIYILKIFMSSL